MVRTNPFREISTSFANHAYNYSNSNSSLCWSSRMSAARDKAARGHPVRTFAELTEREILALAIALEEEHGRIYADYADGLKEGYPASAKVFTEMAAKENEHRRALIELYRISSESTSR